jgi:hypothetical protein
MGDVKCNVDSLVYDISKAVIYFYVYFDEDSNCTSVLGSLASGVKDENSVTLSMNANALTVAQVML